MQSGQRVAGVRVDDVGVEVDQRAAADALVHDGANPVRGADRGREWQGPVQLEALLAVQDVHPVDAGRRVGVPELGPAEHHALAGHGGLRAPFIDVGQLVFIERVRADAEAQRIQRAVSPVVALVDGFEAALDDVLKVHRSNGI